MTDTLGRQVNISYGAYNQPSTITQTWKDTNGSGSNVTYTYATLTYTTKTIATDFDGLSFWGPPNGMDLRVLDKITYADGSYTKFYHNGYAQVWKIENYADDDHKLNHVRTDLYAPAADQTDCPRFTETRTWVENFNDGEDEEDEEILVENSAPINSTYTVSGGSAQDTSVVVIEMPEHPDDLIQEIHFGRTGWNEGLVIATRDCLVSCSTEKRWSWSKWTQDDEEATPDPEDFETYKRNPRVVESRVGDGTNTKRTTVDYYLYTDTSIATFGLPSEVKTYKSDLSTVMKRVVANYDFTSTYIDRRIIGLPTETKTYGWSDGTSSEQYTSRTTYDYDYDDDFATEGLNQNVSPVQHDGTNFGTGLSAGRGNLTKVTRWDVTDDDNTDLDIVVEMFYNKAGSIVAKTSPWDGTNTRTVKISYTDNFNSSPGVSTFAYPTTITDPANNSSTIKYRYDIGANVEAESPAPTDWEYGKRTKRTYDSIGRLQKNAVWWNPTESSWVEQSYVRYEYPDNGIQSKVFATLIDTNANGPDANDEVLAESWFDGAGRVRRARTEHPGSSGGFSAVLTEYDILGRMKRQSVPTEVDSDWDPDGDDLSRGFVWNQREYDWIGRTTRTIPSDSDGTDGKDTLISYEGCGCAGGLETTIQGPLVPRTDTSGDARRKQKAWADILGRTWKTQTYEWDGTTPYLTTETEFNGRDQVLTVEQTDEDEEVAQTSTVSYDGHGRVYQSHRPEQRDGSNNLKYTTYSYNPDDSIQSMTDGRGVVTNYEYNSRGLVTDISWNVGSTGVTDVTDVEFAYDNLGNRTSMIDGLGTMTYAYDSLSRLTGETRVFSDEGTGFPDDTVVLSYTYTLGGQLKSYTTPFASNLQVNYSFDKVGRLTAVSGTNGSGSFDYADSAQFRAWGALKHLEYGNDVEMNATAFNSRLQATGFEVKKNTTYIINKSYEFNADGSVSFEDDHLDARFDRSYAYDHRARLSEAMTGAEARGSTDTNNNIPYRNFYSYDAFGHRTQVSAANFSESPTSPPVFNYTNNRITGADYDDNGNFINDGVSAKIFEYNAAGLIDETDVTVYDEGEYRVQKEFVGHDGDGRTIRIGTFDQLNEETPDVDTNYQIRSTMLGGAVIYDGEWVNVLAGGTRVAMHYPNNTVQWNHSDLNSNSFRSTGSAGTVLGDGSLGVDWDKIETDPDGKSTGFSQPTYNPLDSNDLYTGGWSFGSMVNGQYTLNVVDGIHVPREYVIQRLNSASMGGALGLLFASVREVGRWYRPTKETDIPNLPGPDGILGTDDDIFRTAASERLVGIEYETIWSPINLIAARVIAAQGPPLPQQGDATKLSKDEVGKLRDALKPVLDKKTDRGRKCAKFLENLLKELGGAYSKDFMKIFGAIAEKEGFYVDPDASHSEGVASVDSQPPNVVFGGTLFEGFDDLAMLTIHEVLHVAGRGRKYTHFDLAKAARTVGVKMNLSGVHLMKTPKLGMTKEERSIENGINSGIFDSILSRACGFEASS